MKKGMDWYKRDPLRFLGGVQGMTAKEIAVYTVVLDLIYVHGGSVNNDPSWIAGWIKDMGAHAVRKAIASLVEAGKLEVEGDQLTNFTAKTQAKHRENVSETRAKHGKKGGENTHKKRAAPKENKDLGPAKTPDIDKIREDKSTPLPPEGDRDDLFGEIPRPKEKTALDYLSEVVPEELAKAFIDARRKAKSPITDFGGKLLAADLRKLSDPVESVKQSIKNGWKGVFETSNRNGGSAFGKPPPKIGEDGLTPFERRIRQKVQALS